MTTVCLDAMVFIYAMEHRPEFGPVGLSWLSGPFVASDLALHECLVLPFRRGNAALVRAYESLRTAENGRFVPITPAVLRRAAELRGGVPSLRAADSIHAATALSEGVPFVTADPGFRRVPGLDVRPFGT